MGTLSFKVRHSKVIIIFVLNDHPCSGISQLCNLDFCGIGLFVRRHTCLKRNNNNNNKEDITIENQPTRIIFWQMKMVSLEKKVDCNVLSKG